MKVYIKNPVYAMSNIHPKYTGLSVAFWVDDKGQQRKNKHMRPRIKVQNIPGNKFSNDVFSLSIEEDPKVLAGRCKLTSRELQEVKDYVSRNCEVLLKHWNGEIDTFELKDLLVN